MATLGKCYCCAGKVSSAANSCPHCGQPRPFIPSNVTLLAIGSVHPARVTSIDSGPVGEKETFLCKCIFEDGLEGYFSLGGKYGTPNAKFGIGEVCNFKILDVSHPLIIGGRAGYHCELATVNRPIWGTG